MAKKFILTVLALLIVVGGLVGVKVLQFQTMFAQSAKAAVPPESVATSPVSETSLSPTLDAVGSVVAVQGVTLNAEITGDAGVHVEPADLARDRALGRHRGG